MLPPIAANFSMIAPIGSPGTNRGTKKMTVREMKTVTKKIIDRAPIYFR
jgi:hypothetical protein